MLFQTSQLLNKVDASVLTYQKRFKIAFQLSLVRSSRLGSWCLVTVSLPMALFLWWYETNRTSCPGVRKMSEADEGSSPKAASQVIHLIGFLRDLLIITVSSIFWGDIFVLAEGWFWASQILLGIVFLCPTMSRFCLGQVCKNVWIMNRTCQRRLSGCRFQSLQLNPLKHVQSHQ